MLPRRGAAAVDFGDVDAGMSSTFPQMLERRRSRFAQESFSSVTTVQSCLCSGSSSVAWSSSMAVRELLVGTRPQGVLIGIQFNSLEKRNLRRSSPSTLIGWALEATILICELFVDLTKVKRRFISRSRRSSNDVSRIVY